MKAIWVTEKSPSADNIQVSLVDMSRPKITKDQCLIEVLASSINQSDVKMILGIMPNTVWPRTPGRDYAGVVVEGPKEWLGKAVWGSGGDLGNSRNGAHAEYLVVETESVHERPANINAYEAASIGVPFCTAYLGLVEEAKLKAGDTVAVLGVNGNVGEAVAQIASMIGAKVIGVQRSSEPYSGAAKGQVIMVDSSKENVVEAIRNQTDGKGANVVFNTVGDPYFNQANLALAVQGYHFIISNINKEVTMDISQFYRNRSHLVGLASTFYNSCQLGYILEKLRPGFESGMLKPYPIREHSIYSLENAEEAYESVISGRTKERVILDPKRNS